MAVNVKFMIKLIVILVSDELKPDPVASHLRLPTSFHHSHHVVAPVVLLHAVLTDAAGVGPAEQLQGPLVVLAGPPLDVLQRLHQPVVLELRILQVRPEVGLAVGDQAGEAGLDRPAGVLDAGVTHHVLRAQRFLLCLHLWFLLGLLGVFRLLQILLDLGLLGCLGVCAWFFFGGFCSIPLGFLRRFSFVRTLD